MFKAPPSTTSSSIITHTPSGQRNCASWVSEPQKSVTLLPFPGGRTTKSTKDMWWHLGGGEYLPIRWGVTILTPTARNITSYETRLTLDHRTKYTRVTDENFSISAPNRSQLFWSAVKNYCSFFPITVANIVDKPSERCLLKLGGKSI